MNDKEQHLEHLRRELSLLDQKRSELVDQIQQLQAERNVSKISKSGHAINAHSSETAKIRLFRDMSAVQRFNLPVDKREVDGLINLAQQMVGGNQLFDADELKLRLYT